MKRLNKIACIGEVMIELIAGTGDDALLGVAGDTYNTAVYLKRLLGRHGNDVAYVTALGQDPFSDRIMRAIGSHHLSTDLIERRETHLPGLYAIETDEKGERSFSYWRSQSAARTLFETPCEIGMERLNDFDLLYCSGISIAILPIAMRQAFADFVRQFKEAGGLFAFDSNYRPRLWEDVETARSTTMTFWGLADIALPSADDEMALFGDPDEDAIVDRLSDAGVTFGALKRGAEGPLAIGGSVSGLGFEAVENVVDTTAAGDSFNAGFLRQCAIGGTHEDALIGGHALASKVIQAKGAIVDL